MRVMYDSQIFTMQKYGGISRYFFELINNFDETINTNVSLLLSNNQYISNYQYVPHLSFLPSNEFRGKHRLMTLINKLNSIYEIKYKAFDVFHPTYYDPCFLKYIGSKPFVLTVCDMIHEKFSAMFSRNDKTSKNKKLLCNKATKIIAISQNTKKDLMELFAIEEAKIDVVHLGNSLTLDKKNSRGDELPPKYILFVGARSAYKNFLSFVNGVSGILERDKGLSVICVGGGSFNDTEMQLFDKLKMSNKIYQCSITDDDLSMYYQYAELFVFPSLYEGFGIPILEAFACDCPLVCSNTSSFPEIAGKGGEYFDPYDEKSISIAIENVLSNPQKRELLSRNGRERLKCFSWEKTAMDTKKIYEGLIK